MKNNKTLAFVLLDQLHVDVLINTKMSVKDRSALRKALKSKTLRDGIINLVLVSTPITTTKPEFIVKITQ